MLHAGTLAASSCTSGRTGQGWPAFFAGLRDRSFRDDPDRRLSWLLFLSTIPAAAIAFLLNDLAEGLFRQAGLVAVTLVIGAGIMWTADRWGPRTHDRPPHLARGGGHRARAGTRPGPGDQPVGHLDVRGPVAGLDRADAARYSFLMATPITAMAVAWETLKILRGEVGGAEPATLVVGVLASFGAGILAISVLLRYLRTNSFTIFVVYRLVLAAIVVVAFLAR